MGALIFFHKKSPSNTNRKNIKIKYQTSTKYITAKGASKSLDLSYSLQ